MKAFVCLHIAIFTLFAAFSQESTCGFQTSQVEKNNITEYQPPQLDSDCNDLEWLKADVFTSKKIRIRYHVVRDEMGGHNFTQVEGDVILPQWTALCNEDLSNNQPMSHYYGDIPPEVNPINLQFEIGQTTPNVYDPDGNGIYYWDIEEWYICHGCPPPNDGTDPVEYLEDNYPEYTLDSNYMHVFLLEDYSRWHLGEPSSAVAGGVAGKNAFATISMYYRIIETAEKDPKYATDVMIHELGHILDLDHPYREDRCNDTPLKNNTNNYMDINPGGKSSLSNCQIGKMHRYLTDNKPAYSYPLICDEPDIQSAIDTIWDHQTATLTVLNNFTPLLPEGEEIWTVHYRDSVFYLKSPLISFNLLEFSGEEMQICANVVAGPSNCQFAQECIDIEFPEIEDCSGPTHHNLQISYDGNGYPVSVHAGVTHPTIWSLESRNHTTEWATNCENEAYFDVNNTLLQWYGDTIEICAVSYNDYAGGGCKYKSCTETIIEPEYSLCEGSTQNEFIYHFNFQEDEFRMESLTNSATVTNYWQLYDYNSETSLYSENTPVFFPFNDYDWNNPLHLQACLHQLDRLNNCVSKSCQEIELDCSIPYNVFSIVPEFSVEDNILTLGFVENKTLTSRVHLSFVFNGEIVEPYDMDSTYFHDIDDYVYIEAFFKLNQCGVYHIDVELVAEYDDGHHSCKNCQFTYETPEGCQDQEEEGEGEGTSGKKLGSNLQTSKLKVYPNPAQEKIIIELKDLKEGESIHVYDFRGMLVGNYRVKSSKFQISTLQWASGFYVFERNGEREKVMILNP